jgi:flagellar protein FliS
MNAALAKEFQNRIVNASQSDLVIINYEMLMAELDDATIKFEESNHSGFELCMKQAKRLLRELSDNLDFQYEISRDLMSLYIFVDKKLVEASMKTSIRPIESAKEVLNVLLLGWQQAAKTEGKKGPVIQNGQQVYAGLTYGKGTLNESVYQDSARGFKA